MVEKTKIILDSDVVIHFMKADSFYLLLGIFPEYKYLILDVVYNELKKHPSTQTFVDRYFSVMPDRLELVKFNPTGESRKEYFSLLKKPLGSGESACMIYCRDNHDVLGSSNMRDIIDYCQQNGIVYLTTIDFLYYAFIRKKMTAKECAQFIEIVNANGSHVPVVDIEKYVCHVHL